MADLAKSLDLLGRVARSTGVVVINVAKTPPGSKDGVSDDAFTTEEKIGACRSAADQIVAPQHRSNLEFSRALSLVVTYLLRVHGDKEMTVWTVAEECLNKTIKALITTHHDCILLNLYKAIKVKSSVRSQRAALLKFAQACHHINPGKCRKFIISLLSPLSDIIENGEEALQETLAQAMEGICSTLIFFLREKEANKLIDLFVANLSHPSATIRRAAGHSIIAVCRHYPKLPFNYVVLQLKRLYQRYRKDIQDHEGLVQQQHENSESLTVSPSMSPIPSPSFLPKESPSASDQKQFERLFPSRSLPSAQTPTDDADGGFSDGRDETAPIPDPPTTGTLLGILFCLVQLVKLSELLGRRRIDPRNHMVAHLTFVGIMCDKSMGSSSRGDHNVVSLGMELLQSALSSYGSIPEAWGGHAKALERCTRFLRHIHRLLHDPDTRVSQLAVASNCASLIAKHYPVHFVRVWRALHVKRVMRARQRMEHRSDEPVDGDEDSKTKLVYDYGGDCEDEGDVADLAFHYFLHVLSTHGDPLLRGNSAVFIGSMLVGSLSCCSAEETALLHDGIKLTDPSNVSDNNGTGDGDGDGDDDDEHSSPSTYFLPLIPHSVPELVERLLRLVGDRSSVTAKLACQSIGLCLPALLDTEYGLTCGLQILNLLLEVRESYWLVKVEILRVFGRVDFGVVHFLERHSQMLPSSSATQRRDFPRAAFTNLQERVLSFIVDHCLTSSDGRIRSAAASTLVDLIPNLYFPSQLRADALYSVDRHVAGLLGVNEDARASRRLRIQANLASVVTRLLHTTSHNTYVDAIRGVYGALSSLSQTYSDIHNQVYDLSGRFDVNLLPPKQRVFESLPNPMSEFTPDIVPLALDRLTATPLGTDLELHIDIIRMLGRLVRDASPRQLKPHLDPLYRHLVRVVNILGIIVQGEEPPPFKPVDKSDSLVRSLSSSHTGAESELAADSDEAIKHPLGYFANEPVYYDLYHRLVSTRQNAAASFTEDKFQELRVACLETLSTVVRHSGKKVVPWTEEILGYLSANFDEETVTVVWCIHDLFYCVFSAATVVSEDSILGQSGPLQQRGDRGSSSSSRGGVPSGARGDVLARESANHQQNDAAFLATTHSGQFDYLYNMLPSFPPRQPRLEEFQLQSAARSAYTAHREAIRTLQNRHRNLIKAFEPLVVMSMKAYRVTHDLDLQQAILAMLCQLIRFGVDFGRLDKDGSFLEHVINQILGKKSYLPCPPLILPFVFRFLGLLTIEIPSLLTNDRIVQLTSCVFTSPYWSTSGVLLTSVRSLIRDVFCFTPQEVESRNRVMTLLRDKFFARLLSKIPFPQALEALAMVLDLVKPLQHEWIRYSKSTVATVLPLLSSTAVIVSNQQEIRLLFELLDRVHPCTLAPEQAVCCLLLALHHAPDDYEGPDLLENRPHHEEQPASKGKEKEKEKEKEDGASDVVSPPARRARARTRSLSPRSARRRTSSSLSPRSSRRSVLTSSAPGSPLSLELQADKPVDRARSSRTGVDWQRTPRSFKDLSTFFEIDDGFYAKPSHEATAPTTSSTRAQTHNRPASTDEDGGETASPSDPDPFLLGVGGIEFPDRLLHHFQRQLITRRIAADELPSEGGSVADGTSSASSSTAGGINAGIGGGGGGASSSSSSSSGGSGSGSGIGRVANAGPSPLAWAGGILVLLRVVCCSFESEGHLVDAVKTSMVSLAAKAPSQTTPPTTSPRSSVSPIHAAIATYIRSLPNNDVGSGSTLKACDAVAYFLRRLITFIHRITAIGRRVAPRSFHSQIMCQVLQYTSCLMRGSVYTKFPLSVPLPLVNRSEMQGSSTTSSYGGDGSSASSSEDGSVLLDAAICSWIGKGSNVAESNGEDGSGLDSTRFHAVLNNIRVLSRHDPAPSLAMMQLLLTLGVPVPIWRKIAAQSSKCILDRRVSWKTSIVTHAAFLSLARVLMLKHASALPRSLATSHTCSVSDVVVDPCMVWSIIHHINDEFVTRLLERVVDTDPDLCLRAVENIGRSFEPYLALNRVDGDNTATVCASRLQRRVTRPGLCNLVVLNALHLLTIMPATVLVRKGIEVMCKYFLGFRHYVIKNVCKRIIHQSLQAFCFNPDLAEGYADDVLEARRLFTSTHFATEHPQLVLLFEQVCSFVPADKRQKLVGGGVVEDSIVSDDDDDTVDEVERIRKRREAIMEEIRVIAPVVVTVAGKGGFDLDVLGGHGDGDAPAPSALICDPVTLCDERKTKFLETRVLLRSAPHQAAVSRSSHEQSSIAATTERFHLDLRLLACHHPTRFRELLHQDVLDISLLHLCIVDPACQQVLPAVATYLAEAINAILQANQSANLAAVVTPRSRRRMSFIPASQDNDEESKSSNTTSGDIAQPQRPVHPIPAEALPTTRTLDPISLAKCLAAFSTLPLKKRSLLEAAVSTNKRLRFAVACLDGLGRFVWKSRCVRGEIMNEVVGQMDILLRFASSLIGEYHTDAPSDPLSSILYSSTESLDAEFDVDHGAAQRNRSQHGASSPVATSPSVGRARSASAASPSPSSSPSSSPAPSPRPSGRRHRPSNPPPVIVAPLRRSCPGLVVPPSAVSSVSLWCRLVSLVARLVVIANTNARAPLDENNGNKSNDDAASADLPSPVSDDSNRWWEKASVAEKSTLSVDKPSIPSPAQGTSLLVSIFAEHRVIDWTDEAQIHCSLTGFEACRKRRTTDGEAVTRCYGLRGLLSLVEFVGTLAHSDVGIAYPSLDESYLDSPFSRTADDVDMAQHLVHLVNTVAWRSVQDFRTIWQTVFGLLEDKRQTDDLKCLAIQAIVSLFLRAALTQQHDKLCASSSSPPSPSAPHKSTSPATSSLPMSSSSSSDLRVSIKTLNHLAEPYLNPVVCGGGAGGHGKQNAVGVRVECSRWAMAQCASDPKRYPFFPRPKTLVFLEGDQGSKLELLQCLIKASAHLAGLAPYALVRASTWSERFGEVTSDLIDGTSPYHFNLERRNLSGGAYFPTSYGPGQISITQLRKKLLDERPSGSNASAAVSPSVPQHGAPSTAAAPATAMSMNLFGGTSSFSANIDVGFLLSQFLQTLEVTTKSSTNAMIRSNAIRGIVLASDLFSETQLLSTLAYFKSIVDGDKLDDTVTGQYALYGLLKCLAVLSGPELNVRASELPSHPYIHKKLTEALESSSVSLRMAALHGILNLIEGRVQRLVVPFVAYLFDYIFDALESFDNNNSTSTSGPSSPFSIFGSGDPSSAPSTPTKRGSVASSPSRGVSSPSRFGGKMPPPMSLPPSSPTSMSQPSGTAVSNAGDQFGVPPIFHDDIRCRITMLTVMFELVEQYPKEAETFSHTRRAIDLAIALGTAKSCPLSVRAVVFQGLERLLLSFSLAHSHRDMISQFALNQMRRALSPVAFLRSLGLMVTALYSGNEFSNLISLSASSSNIRSALEKEANDSLPMSMDHESAYLDNVEKVKLLLSHITKQHTYTAELSAKVLPCLLHDFFSDDQAMSLVLGEFVRAKHPTPIRLLMRILYALVRRVGVTGQMIHWVLMCLPSLCAVRPARHSVWQLSLLFLVVSDDQFFHSLFESVVQVEVSFTPGEVDPIVSDVETFLMAASSFYASMLDAQSREAFCAAFESNGGRTPTNGSEGADGVTQPRDGGGNGGGSSAKAKLPNRVPAFKHLLDLCAQCVSVDRKQRHALLKAEEAAKQAEIAAASAALAAASAGVATPPIVTRNALFTPDTPKMRAPSCASSLDEVLGLSASNSGLFSSPKGSESPLSRAAVFEPRLNDADDADDSVDRDISPIRVATSDDFLLHDGEMESDIDCVEGSTSPIASSPLGSSLFPVEMRPDPFNVQTFEQTALMAKRGESPSPTLEDDESDHDDERVGLTRRASQLPVPRGTHAAFLPGGESLSSPNLISDSRGELDSGEANGGSALRMSTSSTAGVRSRLERYRSLPIPASSGAASVTILSVSSHSPKPVASPALDLFATPVKKSGGDSASGRRKSKAGDILAGLFGDGSDNHASVPSPPRRKHTPEVSEDDLL